MKGLPLYAEYRDSGLSWVGAVPAHWTVAPTRTALSQVKRTVGERWSQTVLLSLTKQGVIVRDVSSGEGKFPTSFEDYQVVLPNELVFCLFDMDETPRTVGLARQEGMVTGAYTCFSINREVAEPRFLDWYFLAIDEGKRFRPLYTGLRKVIQKPRFLSAGMALPPLPEQQAIADFLDRETTQIDTLVGKQEQLIETLRERRSAVIDDAFARMDNARQRFQLRRAIQFLTSGSRGWGDYYADSGEKFLRIGNLPRASLDLRGEVQFVDLPPGETEGARTRLQQGDLLFSITAYLGSVAVVNAEWQEAYVSQHVALCRLDQRRLVPKCVGWYMLTTDGQNQLKQGAAGGTKQQLALDDIRGLVVPFLPLTEQRRIVAYLDERTAKIDKLIAKAERLIELAKERRAALITAAVTGHINLQGVA